MASTTEVATRTRYLLGASAVLWVIWGLVHLFAGIMVMAADATDGVAAIADAVDPETLEAAYPDAAGAILNQHGWNLAWIGATTLVAAWFIWRRNIAAIFIAALVGGLADVGYFLFIDLGGYANFFPGSVMTYVSAAAIITSVVAWFTDLRHRPDRFATATPSTGTVAP